MWRHGTQYSVVTEDELACGRRLPTSTTDLKDLSRPNWEAQASERTLTLRALLQNN